jgi:hypothetical protein
VIQPFQPRGIEYRQRCLHLADDRVMEAYAVQRMLRRLCLAAGAALALAGCASESDGYYSQYPDEAYYGPYSYPYYGPYPYYGGYGAFGYDSGFDHDFDHRRHRFFRPSDRVTCDRARDLCYDRYGPSYTATKHYLGERDANASFHKYGDKVVLFSPQHGVTCDRRARTCSDAGGFDEDLTDRYFSGRGMAPRVRDSKDEDARRKPVSRLSRSFDQDEAPVFKRKPEGNAVRYDHDQDQPKLPPRLTKPRLTKPQGMADNDDGDSGPAVRLQQNRPDRPGPAGGGVLRPQKNGNAAGGGCPPKGCSNK